MSSYEVDKSSTNRASDETPLDLSALSSRKRKQDDGDDDVICVGVSSGGPTKSPRIDPRAVMLHPAYANMAGGMYTHATHTSSLQTAAHHRSSQITVPTVPQRSTHITASLTRNKSHQHSAMTQKSPTGSHGIDRNYSAHLSPHSTRIPHSSAIYPSQGKSLLEQHIIAYRSGQKPPPRPAPPSSAPPRRMSLSTTALSLPDVRSSGTGSAIRKTSNVEDNQRKMRQLASGLVNIGSTALNIQLQKRQMLAQATATPGQEHTTAAGSAAVMPSIGYPRTAGVGQTVSPAGAMSGASITATPGPSTSQTAPVPPNTNRNSGIDDRYSRQLHNIQIQGGRMLAHQVVGNERPGISTQNKSKLATPGSLVHAAPHRDYSKEKVTYMKAPEPVRAGSASGATPAQIIHQQQTFIGQPLTVPNPIGHLISRYGSNSSVSPLSQTADTQAKALSYDAKKSEEFRDNNERSESGNSQSVQATPSVPQKQTQEKHFTNTDTQTSDMPSDMQWHNRPFQRMGMPHKNIPIANVNPMVHTKCSSPALHPKKQNLMLYQSQAAHDRDEKGQERKPPSVTTTATVASVQATIEPPSVDLKQGENRDNIQGKGHQHHMYTIKERIMKRMNQTGEFSPEQNDIKSESDSSSRTISKVEIKTDPSIKHKRKYTKRGMGPLMKKAMQAGKKEVNTSLKIEGKQDFHQRGNKPVLSKTVLDLSDITGESPKVEPRSRKAPRLSRIKMTKEMSLERARAARWAHHMPKWSARKKHSNKYDEDTEDDEVSSQTTNSKDY